MARPRKDGSPSRKPNKRKLTPLYVLKHKEPGLTWDTEQKGLVLKVEPTGSRSFKCIYTFGKRERWYHIGDATAIHLADHQVVIDGQKVKIAGARSIARHIMAQVAEGHDPAANRKAQRALGTFKDLHQRYLDEHAKVRNKSWKQADALIRGYVLPRVGELQSRNVGREDIKNLLKGLKPIMHNQVLAATSAVFSWSIKQGELKDNPCKGITRNPTNERERVLSDEELPRFWNAFDQAGLDGIALKLILVTGARPGEVTNMRKAHINGGWWTLPGKPEEAVNWPGTKNACTHDVWIAEALHPLLEEYLDAHHDHLNLDWRMQQVCRDLKIANPVRPHDLRRTFGTKVTTIGYSREEMDRLLNHRKKSIGDVYDRTPYKPQNKEIWIDTAQHILGLAKAVANH
jgi:integrase